MWGLFLTFFTSVLVLYLASYGIVLKSQYETMEEIWGRKTVYEELLTSNSTSNSTDLQQLVTGDVDVKRDNCMQAVAQICLTLSWECRTRNALDTWGWAIAAVAPDFDDLEESKDYVIVSYGTTIESPEYVDLKNVPPGEYVEGCGREQLVKRGAYYYNSIARVLGCDEYQLDLNGINVSGSKHPCTYVDTLRYKQ